MLFVNDEDYLLVGYLHQLSENFAITTAENGLQAL
jgi:hypothetical protein